MLFGKKTKPKALPRKPVQDSRFSMRMSSEWEDKTPFYYIEGPEEDGIKHNIVVQIDEEVDLLDAKEYSLLKIKELSNELPAYQEVRQGPVRLSHRPNPAYEVVYKWKIPEKRELYQRVMFVLSKKVGFILTATFSEKTFKRLASQIDQVYRSFSAT